MADFTLDWTGANLEGGNVVSNGTDNITATVTTPANGSTYGEFAYENLAAPAGTLGSFYPTAGSTATVGVSFDAAVENVTFDIFDVDADGTNWDDLVTIVALDAFGNQVVVTFTNTTTQTVVGNTIEGETNLPSDSFITVNIAGPIVSLEVQYTNGPDDDNAGWIALSDITFDANTHCFTRGTMIETENGPVAVEDLVEGDNLKTLDNGYQPVRWIGSRSVKGVGPYAPVLIKEGTMGNMRDLLVSPAHRMMLEGWQTELLFGESQLLASARSLVNDSTIIRQECAEIEYFHLLLDKHEIIFAEGAATESFHPGEVANGSVDNESRKEILALFPELDPSFKSYGPAARSVLKPHETSLLAS